MRWLAIAVAALVAINVVIVLIGMMLPRDHVASMRTRIAASPDEIWEALTDVVNYRYWRPDVHRTELLPPMGGKTAWREYSSNGAIAMVVEEAQPPARLVTRIADDKLPFGGTWTYAITADGAGSIVSITEHGSVSNPIVRLLSRFVFGHTATMDTYLRSLSRKFGDEAAPAPVAIESTNH